MKRPQPSSSKPSTTNVSILSCFQPLFTNNYTYYVYYGGRGGGKSEGVAQCLAILAAKYKLRILCIRETQNTIADSVKTTIEQWIVKMGLESFFTITRDEISSITGSKFLFRGMQNYNAANIKSISQVDITWIEEAEAFSKRSWELLVPSVLRTENPKIICTFNPALADDIVYRTFLSHTPPPKSFIKKINWRDNPYFPKFLEEKRRFDEENLPEGDYKHIWEGELISFTAHSLWNEKAFKNLVSNEPYESNQYVKTIVAADPATTNKDFSNEYGVVVCGATEGGLFHVIEDASGHYDPEEFANQIVTQYYRYNCTEVVVEVNNGGDFIKSTLLKTDPRLNITEVRAARDKVQRALPVANLAYQNKIRHINGGFPLLERQMKLTTTIGYQGPKGESPDRLDAMVWGIYALAGLSDTTTSNTIFKAGSLKPLEFEASKIIALNTELTFLNKTPNGLYILIRFDLLEYDFKHIRNFTKVSTFNSLEDLRTLLVTDPMVERPVWFLRDIPLNREAVQFLAKHNQVVKTYDDSYFKTELSKRAYAVAGVLTTELLRYRGDMECCSYRAEFGNQLLLQLSRYSEDSQPEQFEILDYFCDIIAVEFNLDFSTL